jgi:hypothetical protein
MDLLRTIGSDSALAGAATVLTLVGAAYVAATMVWRLISTEPARSVLIVGLVLAMMLILPTIALTFFSDAAATFDEKSETWSVPAYSETLIGMDYSKTANVLTAAFKVLGGFFIYSLLLTILGLSVANTAVYWRWVQPFHALVRPPMFATTAYVVLMISAYYTVALSHWYQGATVYDAFYLTTKMTDGHPYLPWADQSAQYVKEIASVLSDTGSMIVFSTFVLYGAALVAFYRWVLNEDIEDVEEAVDNVGATKEA